MEKNDIRCNYLVRQRIADDARIAYWKAIKEARVDFFDMISRNDEMWDWLHDKAYELLPLWFALNPKNIDKPHNTGLELICESIHKIVLREPERPKSEEPEQPEEPE